MYLVKATAPFLALCSRGLWEAEKEGHFSKQAETLSFNCKPCFLQPDKLLVFFRSHFSTSKRKASRISKGSISASAPRSSLATFSSQRGGAQKMVTKSMSDSPRRKCWTTLINWDVKMDGNRDDAKVKRRPQVCWFSAKEDAFSSLLGCGKKRPLLSYSHLHFFRLWRCNFFFSYTSCARRPLQGWLMAFFRFVSGATGSSSVSSGSSKNSGLLQESSQKSLAETLLQKMQTEMQLRPDQQESLRLQQEALRWV